MRSEGVRSAGVRIAGMQGVRSTCNEWVKRRGRSEGCRGEGCRGEGCRDGRSEDM